MTTLSRYALRLSARPRALVPDALTPAQDACMELLAQGKSYEEISCIRGVKYDTVCTQLFDAFAKLGAEGQGYRARRRDAVAKWLAKQKGE
jgi:DNA-binding CsgD family transcriptional regulator